MTIFRADPQTMKRWGGLIEDELDLTQALAADPHLKRTFRLIGQQEFTDLTGATAWEWKTYIKQLKDQGALPLTSGFRAQVTLEQVHEYMDRTNNRPTRPDGVTRGIRIAIANFKGGAAKSTTTFHLGTRLAMLGYRVLLIDLDGQATLTRMMGLQPYNLKSEQTFAAAIGMYDEGNDTEIGDARPLQPLKTYVSGMDIVPAGMAVTSIDMELSSRMREDESHLIMGMFTQALEGVDSDYDFVLMDFQPSFSLSQLLVMWMADSLLLPVPTETPDFAGTGDFLRLTGKWLEELGELFGKKTFDPVLALHVRSKLKRGAESPTNDKDRAELERRVSLNNAVFGAAGKVFGAHRPMDWIEDRTAVSRCLHNMKSVYEADAQDYDLKAIKLARAEYNALFKRVVEAVQLRWAEVAANGGSYDSASE